MVKYLPLLLLLISPISYTQTNCRSECIASGKSHICQWQTVCDPVTPSPTPEPAPPPPTPEPIPLPPQPAPLPPPQVVPLPNQFNPTNMANPLNPVSPISPLNQTPKTVLPISLQDLLLLLTLEEDYVNEEAIQESTQTQLAAPAKRGKILIQGIGLALSIDTFITKIIKQNSVFPVDNMNQPLPIEYKNAGQFFMDIYGVSLPNQTSKFNSLKQDAVELEQ
jgi:hypothetical protein